MVSTRFEIVGTGSSGSSNQGNSVSLSADGNVLAVGGGGDSGGVGSSWVFTRNNSSWSQQGLKLMGTGNTGSSNQGISIALSADGNTLAVGASTDGTSKTGATWIFLRSGTTWSQQGNKLVGNGAFGATGSQGISVALSANGNTLAVGGDGDNSNAGATWIFK